MGMKLPGHEDSVDKKKRIEQVISRVLFPSGITPQWTMIIHLGLRLLAASSDLPESLGGPPSTLSYLVLLQVGFAEPPMSPPELVSSYLTVSPLPQETNGPRGGLLSVALSSPPAAEKRQARGSDHLTYSILTAPSDMSLYLPPAGHDLWPHSPTDQPLDSIHGLHEK